MKKPRGIWEVKDPRKALGLLWDDVRETAERLHDSLDRSKFVESSG